MTDKIEDTSSPAAESREGKRARQFKSMALDLLEEVVDIMEQARKEGFEVQFSVQRNAEGANIINNELLKVIKVW